MRAPGYCSKVPCLLIGQRLIGEDFGKFLQLQVGAELGQAQLNYNLIQL